MRMPWTAPEYDIGPDPVDELIEAELRLEEHVVADHPLRVKVTEDCGLSCTFCHNEGTVAPNETRQSIYIPLMPKDARLTATAMEPDNDLRDVFTWMYANCETYEVHWTGGEPTLNRHLPELVALADTVPLVNKMTSNGQRGGAMLAELAAAGLRSVNYSIYGLNPDQFQATQVRQGVNLAEKRIAALHEAIAEALHVGLRVKANMVVGIDDAYEKITDALETLDPRVELRFQPDLRDQRLGTRVIRTVLSALGGHALRRTYSSGSSNQLIEYSLDDYDGREVGMKSFRHSRMPAICAGCPIDAAGDCDEGYYGPRLFKKSGEEGIGKYIVGVCLQRMELAVPFDQLRADHESVALYNRQDGVERRRSLAHEIRRFPDEDMASMGRGDVTRYFHHKEGTFVTLPRDERDDVGDTGISG